MNRYWHPQQRRYLQISAGTRRLRIWEAGLGESVSPTVQDFDAREAMQSALDALLMAKQAEGFVEHIAMFATELPRPERWREWSSEQCVAELKARGFGFNVKDFKRTMRLWQWEAPDAFELFLAAGILGKVKAPDGLIREAIGHGTPAMAMALLDALPDYEMDGDYFARRVMMDAVCDAIHEDLATPLFRAQWRALVLRLLERVDQIDVLYTFRSPMLRGIEELFTPLQRAVAMRDPEIVTRLLAKGADVHRCYPDHLLLGGTVLHFLCAMRDPDPEVARCLLDAGVPLEARDSKGRTALGIACSNRHGECLALVHGLVEHGVQVLALQSDDDDRTALTLSLLAKHFNVADYLVESCPQLPHTVSANFSPLGLALRAKQSALAKKIYNKGGYRPYVGLGGSAGPMGGLRIEQVGEQSSAALAGLQVGDIVWEVCGIAITSTQELRDLVHAQPAGQPMTIRFERAGESREIAVPVGVY